MNTKKTIVVCESPWYGGKTKRFDPYSMLPFMQGIASLWDAKLIYRSFTTQEELKNLLGGEAFESRRGPTLLYISTHGQGKRLYPAKDKCKGINLGSLGLRLCKGVEGVWLGACLVGEADANFLRGGRSIFVGGYTCEVDWAPSALIDLAIVQAWLARKPLRNKEDTISLFSDALRCFSPNWVIGEEEGTNRDIPLENGFAVMARNKTPGFTAARVTDDILRSLNWRDQAVHTE